MNLRRRIAIKEFLPRQLALRVSDATQVLPYTGGQAAFNVGLENFLSEARKLAQFQDYPGIIRVFDFFPENGTGYMVMEYLDGSTLEQYVTANGHLDVQVVLQLLIPVADALRACHAAGLIHRDISPDNIFVTSDGRVKLLDFGAARFAIGSQSTNLSVILKEGYAPFEQYQRNGRQGPWTDIYALTATLHRLLTGDLLPTAPDRVAGTPLPSPSEKGVKLPPGLQAVLDKGLAIRPEQRYQTIDAFLSDLKRLLPEPPPPPTPPPVGILSWLQAHWPIPAIGATLPTWAARLAWARKFFKPDVEPVTTRFFKPDVEPVDAAVFCPPRVKTKSTFLVQVYLYQPPAADEAAMQAHEADTQAVRRGTYSLPLDIPRGTHVAIHLEMEDFEIAEPDAVLVWRGRITSAQFEVVVPTTKLGNTIGRVRFAVSGIPAGTLRSIVEVVAQYATAKPTWCEANAVRYHRAFASYSSEDRGEVLRRVQAFRIAGLSVFQDILELEPGQRWERALYHEIDLCDVFLLFWSRAAAASEWVAKEIDFALNRKGGDDERPPIIEPVPIEGPPPVPPPARLRHRHFNDALLAHIKATSTQDLSEGPP
jgi:hypothetical protein